MNYFAHGRTLIDDPYMLAGACVPDWLNVVDRKVRARRKFAVPLVDHELPEMGSLARGVVRHHDDDHWFHATPAFAALQWEFTVLVRDTLSEERGLRPSFLGHILVELLLDADLIASNPMQLDAFYDSLGSVDSLIVQQHVEQMTGREIPRLAEFIDIFLRIRFLYDYLDDGKLLKRLNQVMARVRLPELPERFIEILPEARKQVSLKCEELISPGA